MEEKTGRDEEQLSTGERAQKHVHTRYNDVMSRPLMLAGK
jgi:hypothetical protein